MDNSTHEQPLPASQPNSAASGYYANGVAVPGGHHIYPEIAPAGLWTTPTDLARFLIELQSSLRGASNRVLSRENAESLLTEVRRNYALGFDLWTHRGQPYFSPLGIASPTPHCPASCHPKLRARFLHAKLAIGPPRRPRLIPRCIPDPGLWFCSQEAS